MLAHGVQNFCFGSAVRPVSRCNTIQISVHSVVAGHIPRMGAKSGGAMQLGFDDLFHGSCAVASHDVDGRQGEEIVNDCPWLAGVDSQYPSPPLNPLSFHRRRSDDERFPDARDVDSLIEHLFSQQHLAGTIDE